MEVVGWVALAYLVKKIVDVIKQLSVSDVKAALTQFLTWGVAIAVVFIAAEADVTAGLGWGDFVLGDLDGASKLLGGLMLGAGGSLLNDGGNAIDSSASQAQPKLGGPA